MKKVKCGNRSSAAKGNGAPKNGDEYLAGVPEPARGTFNKICAAIRSALPPEATESISYVDDKSRVLKIIKTPIESEALLPSLTKDTLGLELSR